MSNDFKKIIDASLESYEGVNKTIKYIGEQNTKEVERIIKTISVEKYDVGKIFLIKDQEERIYEFKIESINMEDKFNHIYEVHIKKAKHDKEKKKNNHLKNKYEKYIYIENKILNYINDIGIINAQVAHAQNEEVEQYITLRDFLKMNPLEFSKKELYIRNEDDTYFQLRHKNLFSKYKDEISDFEKITYIQREEDGKLQITFNLDEKILEYDQTQSGLLERKNARIFAKAIYNKKGLFSDKELIKELKTQAIYIKINKIISAQNKLVWEKIQVKDMNIKVLKKEYIKEYKTKIERVKNIQLKYLSKRNKRRKLRRENKLYIKEGLKEYYNNEPKE